MKLSKVRLTKDASNRLRFVAGRTGLTPNLLCRIGFCISLAEPSIPNYDSEAEEDREFNRYTLLGEYDALFVAMLKQRCSNDGVPEQRLVDMFKAHLNRGVEILQKRTKSLPDLVAMISQK